jgi:hypothetical protein
MRNRHNKPVGSPNKLKIGGFVRSVKYMKRQVVSSFEIQMVGTERELSQLAALPQNTAAAD